MFKLARKKCNAFGGRRMLDNELLGKERVRSPRQVKYVRKIFELK